MNKREIIRIPTISEMLPLSMRVEFFRRILNRKTAKVHWWKKILQKIP